MGLCKTGLALPEEREAFPTRIRLKNWYHAKHRKTHGLNLGRASHRPVQELDEKREKETERKSRSCSAGDDDRPVGPIRFVRKGRRLDERETLGTLFVRKPRAALRPQQVRRDLGILLPDIVRLRLELHRALEDRGSA